MESQLQRGAAIVGGYFLENRKRRLAVRAKRAKVGVQVNNGVVTSVCIDVAQRSRRYDQLTARENGNQRENYKPKHCYTFLNRLLIIGR